ncbi:hypothetical protein QAD02_023524 [Eretmocerus hayati]|uniref:Uncharacterized protein n=1 Tax=Eretmocerus hayati TaxID=131215 RepID=A0ACC2PVW2_9HYME|nr:hypothetical protein QAD02_023524 [Eretmocerus hayati]
MSEGQPSRPKRNGARAFKNPPQPHMCILDSLKGSTLPCYINILSWDKMDKPSSVNMTVPLYGGMKLNPPRTEDKDTCVFAVIANPDVLKERGKSSQDIQDQSNLIHLLLDFVESMNKGVIFNRSYTILKDRDITGELKEVWMIVQSQYELSEQRPQLPPQQKLLPQLRPPQLQLPQQHIQQNQQMMQNSYLMSQPPQYPPNLVYNHLPINDWFNYPSHGSVPVEKNNDVYQRNYCFPPAHENRFSERPRLLPQQPVHPNQPPPPLHFQQLGCPRFESEIAAQPTRCEYPSFEMAPNLSDTESDMPISAKIFALDKSRRRPQKVNMDQLPPDSQMLANHVQMIQQQQEQQMHRPPPLMQGLPQLGPQYQPLPSQPPPNVKPVGRFYVGNKNPHAGGPYRNNSGPKRQNNSPTHAKQASVALLNNASIYGQQPKEIRSESSCVKPKSPVKVLQRDQAHQSRPNVRESPAERDSQDLEKGVDHNHETCNVQVTDLDEDLLPVSVPGNSDEFINEKPEALNYTAALKELKQLTGHSGECSESVGSQGCCSSVQSDENFKSNQRFPLQDSASSSSEIFSRELIDQEQDVQKQSKKNIPKKNKSCANDLKAWTKDAKSGKNGIKIFERSNSNSSERPPDKDSDENLKTLPSSTRPWKTNVKQKASDSPKRTQSTVNSIIKSVFKIHQGNNTGEDEVGMGKKPKMNGQVKANMKGIAYEHEEFQFSQGYTILKKAGVMTSTTRVETGEMVNEIAQLSIQDCNDTTEMNAVLS